MDGPRRAMTPDPDSLKYVNDETYTCDECGATVRQSEWPWCKGDPSKHKRG